MKKIFISFLLVAIFNLLLGCYSSKLVTVPEYNQIEEEDKPDEIRVITKDSQEYHFSESNFYVANDTLYEKDVIALSEKWIPFEGKFAFEEIEEIEFYSKKNKWTYRFIISEYENYENEKGQPDEIILIKSDSAKYYFKKDDYFISNDTLYGNGKSLLAEGEEISITGIALSNIESIEFEYVSWPNRIFRGVLFFSIVGIISLLVVTLTWLI
jgi:hypothetical protein